jgi:hypothetical protein
MKKILIIATVASALSGLSAFGQGYFEFVGPTRGVWDGFSTGVPRLSTNMTAAFLFSSSTSVSPTLAGLYGPVPTNSAGFSYNATAAWNAIMTDPNFHFATDGNNGNVIVTTGVGGNGSINYLTAASFPVAGSVVGNNLVYVIAWDKSLGATPAAAAAAGAAVGWSAVLTYNAVAQIGTPPSLTAAGFIPFGVAAVPEPTMFTLAGLGSALMLILRRRR